jgi:MFS superfamily sulfate permease-like transporter
MSTIAVIALVGFALCCGVMFGVFLAMFIGYSYARTRTETSTAEEEKLVEEITARIAQEYIDRAEKVKTA